MIVLIIFIVLGFVLLIQGANWLINGASLLAKKHQISDLVIGLTVVAFGTSAPELVVNCIASIHNQSDIVLGNVLGSNVFNLFAILGLVGVIYPITVETSIIKKEIPILLGAVILFLLLANNFFLCTSGLSRIDGVGLLLAFCGFLFYVFKQIKKDKTIASDIIPDEVSALNLKIWILIGIGLGSSIFGGKLVVENTTTLAKLMGVTERIIGLTIVAAGTSLPELVTSVMAAIKKNSNIAIGNIIGSTIFNILLILGTSAVIRPITFNINFNITIFFLIGGTLVVLLAMFTGEKKKIDRWEAALLLISFLMYNLVIL